MFLAFVGDLVGTTRMKMARVSHLKLRGAPFG
jgi:hypothetical protein